MSWICGHFLQVENFQRSVLEIDNAAIQWFMQLSDTHISIFTEDSSRQDDLRSFLEHEVSQVIRPPVLLVTGDLVHATFKDNKYRVLRMTDTSRMS